MGNRELSRLSPTAIESNGWIRKSLCNRLKGFILLNEAKLYYIDVKETFGGDYPLEDLVEVCNDIQALTSSTSRLQEIVTQTIQMKKVKGKALAPKPTVKPPKKVEQTKVDKAVEKAGETASEAKAGPASEDRTD